MPYLNVYSKQDILSLTKIRRFETKLGEAVQVLKEKNNWEQKLAESTAKFVLLGIPEDVGVKANCGVGGTSTAWMAFLSSFLNIQSNDFLTGEELLVLGHLNFAELDAVIESNAQTTEEKLIAYRHAVNTIDDSVENVVRNIVLAGKIPIVIGGGHNNSYPLIKGAAKALHKSGKIDIAEINAINLDAHTDYRPIEGRHSGNGFRYAEEDGYLEKYCVLGVHENYLPQNIWVDIVNNPFMDMITMEDMFVHGKQTFRQALSHAVDFTSDTYCGIELDMDVIADSLTSAASPVGINPLHARQYINHTSSRAKVAYLHICEGAFALQDGRKNDLTGKLISYLVSDFMKALQTVEVEQQQSRL
jgi:formiminoglutamase